MTTIMNFEKEVIKCVRGEKDWSSLRECGVDISLQGEKWVIASSQHIPVCPKIRDFAIGILNLYHNKGKIKTWASFLLAASSIVDFTVLEESEKGDTLLNSLWDISFGQPIDEKTLLLAQKILSEAT
jgi:hypothetical protein